MTTVHPHLEDGAVYNLVTRYHQTSHYRFYQLRGAGRPELVASLPVREPAYLHSFGMSRRYFILAEFPLVVNPLSLLLWLRPYIENFRWQPRRGAPFYVFDRRTGELAARLDSDPYFAFHHVNAFERGDELVVDLVAYPDAGIIQSYYLSRLADDHAVLPWGTLRRYRLPLKGRRGRASYETIADVCMELPRFDYQRYNMDGSYRYVYAISMQAARRQGFYNQLVKVDLHTGQTAAWHAPDCYPGEPVFVGAPGRAAEDEGVILSVVLDAARGTSFLLVLDARTFAERARAEIPHPVLFGYHGEFFAA
jgi:carotenoid cleavage dioxygenase-like enzyme